MPEKSAASNPNFRIPGQRGPRFATVEKPAEGKKTLLRLTRYFKREKRVLILLLCVVTAVVICSVLAPAMQSQSIDHIAQGEFDQLPRALAVLMGI